MMRAFSVAFILVALVVGNRLAADDLPERQHFEQQVKPILVGHCLECHGEAGKSGLDLRRQSAALAGGKTGKVIEPGHADASLLYEYVKLETMPPKEPLTGEQVSAIKKWIDDGAWYPDEPLDLFSSSTDNRAGRDWWSLQPINVTEPIVTDDTPESWRTSPIDKYVAAKLAEKNLTPSSPADPRTLLRRASYDLTGLPPSPEQAAAFVDACRAETGVENQVGEQAYTRVIDELLQSPRYGEQWGRHWLDVVRFGESNGYERNVIHMSVWPFRDYVIRSLNEDKPFDRLVMEHLAGDVLAPDDPKVAIGTAFLVCGPYDDVGNQDPVAAAQIRADAIDEVIRATTEAFLGLTVGCSRCHDHKFDPIAQRDYYSFYATFAGVQHGERAIGTKNPETGEEGSPPTWWVGTYAQINGPFHVFKGGSPQQLGDTVVPASMSTLQDTARGYELSASSPESARRLALANWIIAADNPLTPRVIANRLWHYHFGTGIVDTPSDFGFLGGRPTHPELLDWLASELKANGWRLKPLHRKIMLSQTYRQSGNYRAEAGQIDGDSRLLWRFPPRRLTAEQIRDSTLAVAGKLNLQMGGPGFRLFKYFNENVSLYTPLDKHGEETYRRAVYHHNARAMQIDLLSEFDAPDCAFTIPRRSRTTTPLQSLTLMNHSFTIDMADALAERIASESATADAGDQVNRAFQLLYLRRPDEQELAAAQALIEAHGLRAFCRAMLNTNEFLNIE